MNKHLTFIALCCTVLLAIFSSCEDEERISYMPTWRGFSYSPKPVRLGDSVTIVAEQAEIGHLIYKAVYTWKATYTIPAHDGSDSTVTITKPKTVVYDNEPADPQVRFLVPGNVASRNFTVSFTGVYQYSAHGMQGSDGSIVGEGTSGSLHRSQSGLLEGTSTGTLNIPIN